MMCRSGIWTCTVLYSVVCFWGGGQFDRDLHGSLVQHEENCISYTCSLTVQNCHRPGNKRVYGTFLELIGGGSPLLGNDHTSVRQDVELNT